MKAMVFLDTNILLDLFLERPGFEDAARILQAGEEGRIELYCSFLTMANLAFILRKTVPSARLVPSLWQIRSLMKVLPMDDGQLSEACQIDGRDFEDILQAVCAQKGGCTHIVTRNTADFNYSPLTVCTPEEFLSQINGSA